MTLDDLIPLLEHYRSLSHNQFISISNILMMIMEVRVNTELKL